MKLEKGDFARYAEVDREQMEVNARNDFRPAGSTCVHAQQYVEKMLKDKIVELFDEEPLKTHDLLVLLRAILPDIGAVDDSTLHKVSILTSYYMASRYPDVGLDDDWSEETAEEAYTWSKEIVEFIGRISRDESGNIVIKGPDH